MPKLSIHLTEPPNPLIATTIAGYAITKPIANGVNHLPRAARQGAGAATTGRIRRCLSQGSSTSEKASLPAPTTATMENNKGQRVVTSRLFLMSVTVLKPISGKKRPRASRAVMPASRRARTTKTRCAGAPSVILYFLDIRPAEQALRQEYQCYRQYGKGRDVFIVDGKISRPECFNQTDQDAADHGAWQRADAAKHGGSESLHARHEPVGETHHAIIHQVHGAGDGGEGCCDYEGYGDRLVDIDADQRRHLLVLLTGTLRAPKSGFCHQIPERRQQHGGDAPDDKLLVRQGDGKIVFVQQDEFALHHRRDRFVARALRHLHEIRQKDRHADRRNQRRQPERATQRPIGDALDRPVDQRSKYHGHDQYDE